MDKLAQIKVISFDADGTLWDFIKVMKHSLKYVLKALHEIDPESAALLDIDKMIQIRNKVANDLKGIIINLEEVRLRAFRETLQVIKRPNDELAKYLNEVYLKHRFEDIELYEDVLPTLNTLKKKYTLGILSNGNSYPELCGLDEMFQFTVFAQDYGMEKPDPLIFEVALKEANCTKQQIIHIGDSLESDIVGANNAGIQCVWINKEQKENTTNLHINYEITSLSELLDFL
ncbi:MAG: HAD family hydrolase [Candidatus Heimdallarchaeota archaeon]|nr:HAD family hydrolase [Candidatus Heimdallarchaeota archaeon]MCG3253164.1 HAD family hydrolase [Candidatus Heimdallarchaeota archaeon]MCK4290301.1 HAD family hydrolase [Candidatus Heimdallarchaeota archaeon]